MNFLFFLLPTGECPEGLWMRKGDRFDGCVLRVEKLGTELVGRLVVLPESMRRAGWVEGDLKWRNIAREHSGGWRMQDLRKHYDTRAAMVTMVDYCEYKLTVGMSGKLRLHTGGHAFFPAQRWVRYSRTS